MERLPTLTRVYKVVSVQKTYSNGLPIPRPVLLSLMASYLPRSMRCVYGVGRLTFAPRGTVLFAFTSEPAARSFMRGVIGNDELAIYEAEAEVVACAVPRLPSLTAMDGELRMMIGAERTPDGKGITFRHYVDELDRSLDAWLQRFWLNAWGAQEGVPMIGIPFDTVACRAVRLLRKVGGQAPVWAEAKKVDPNAARDD